MNNKVKFLIAGDFCQRGEAANRCTPELIEKISAPIREKNSEHDISMVNVETVFTDSEEAITKSGPCIKSPAIIADMLQAMNFTIGACANNHIGDYGDKGVIDTLEKLHSIGMMTVGAGKNEEEADKILYIEKNGIKISVINCCEHEFGVAEKNKPGTSAFDYYKTSHQIKLAEGNSDKVIVFIHGGNEHNPVPRYGMIKMCHFFAECGADAVIVAHPHCPQGYEIYNNVPIVYSMGNFFMSRATNGGMWEKGYSVSLEIEKDKPVKLAEIIPYIQKYDGSSFEYLEGADKKKALKYIELISALFKNEEIYEKLTLAWADMYIEDYKYFIEGTQKSPDSEFTLFTRNTYSCESHCELMNTYYKAFCEKKLDNLNKYKEMIKILQSGEIPAL